MLRSVGVIFIASAVLASGARASVTGIVTSSSANLALTPGAPPGGNYSFIGTNIAGAKNDLSPSGATYNSTSDVVGPEISFENGNVTSGSYATATTFTSLDVTFQNDNEVPVQATVHSTLLPAGMGLFVASTGCAAAPVVGCTEAVGAPGFAGLPYNDPSQQGDGRIAFASFDFNILNGQKSLFSLTGSITLNYDPATGRNVVVSDIGRASRVLTGFSLYTPQNNPTSIAYVWDATDIVLNLGVLGGLQSTTLTYTTSVTTFTRSFGVGGFGMVAFSEFGDPIGRGGSIPPPNAGLALSAFGGGLTDGGYDPRTGLKLQRPSLFKDPLSAFINVTTVPLSTVPEPATWALYLMGFGLAGAALRRRRMLAA